MLATDDKKVDEAKVYPIIATHAVAMYDMLKLCLYGILYFISQHDFKGARTSIKFVNRIRKQCSAKLDSYILQTEGAEGVQEFEDSVMSVTELVALAEQKFQSEPEENDQGDEEEEG